MSWILHIFSLVALPFYAYAFFAINRRRALFFLAFVHIYFIDTLIDIGFTIVFCVKWFALARSATRKAKVVNETVTTVIDGATRAVAKTAAETAKTVAKHIATTAVALTAEALETGTQTVNHIKETATLDGTPDSQIFIKRAVSAATSVPSKQSTSVARESTVIILLTVVILLIRIYFTFVLIGYARQLVRSQNLRSHNGKPKGSFSARLQYILLAPLGSFWTGLSSSSSSNSYALIGDTRNNIQYHHHQQADSIISDSTFLGNADDDNYSDNGSL